MADEYTEQSNRLSRLQGLYDKYNTSQEEIQFFCYLYCLGQADFDGFFNYLEDIIREEYKDCQ